MKHLCLCVVTVLGCLCVSPAIANSPATIKQAVFDALMAEQIAIDCPTIRQNKGADRSLDKIIRKAARDNGMSVPRYYEEVIPFSQSEIVAYGNSFMRAQGIDENDPASWCSAGNRLIDSGDRVGKFLQKR